MPKTTSIDIGNEALKKLNLPQAHELDLAEGMQAGYAHVGQCLQTLLSGKPLNSYHRGKFLEAFREVAAIAANPPLAPTDQASAQAWVYWLQNCPAVVDAKKANKTRRDRQQTEANPLLRFYAALLKSQETQALTASQKSIQLTLARLRSGPPPVPPGAGAAILGFVLPLRGKQKWKVLFTVRLELRAGTQPLQELAPTADHPMVITNAFFDEDGEPFGSYDAAALADVANQPWSETALATWDGFIAELDARCEELFGGKLHEFAQRVFGNHQPNLSALLLDAEEMKPSLWNEVYEKLISGDLQSTPVETALTGVPAPAHVRLAGSGRSAFLGHMDTRSANDPEGIKRAPAYPLDATQRLAAIQAVTLSDRPGQCILPINGPPGTGKTSFLRAVLASGWVQSALDKAPSPPIVLGTGATNKAVSNIIDAFSEVPGMRRGTLECRWLDGLSSYGWLFPSKKAAEAFPGLMQLGWDDQARTTFWPKAGAEGFADTPVAEHTIRYLANAALALRLSSSEKLLPEHVVEMLHHRLSVQVAKMRSEQTAYAALLEQIPTIWNDGRLSLTELADVKASAIQSAALIAQLLTVQGRVECAAESGAAYLKEAKRMLTGWRAWVPKAIASTLWAKEVLDLKSLEASAQQAFTAARVEFTTVLPLLRQTLVNLHAKSQELQIRKGQLLTQRNEQDLQLRTMLERRTRRVATLQSLKAYWSIDDAQAPGVRASLRAIRNFSRTEQRLKQSAEDSLWAMLDEKHDLVYRVPLFHLAARYWEGRWIIATNTNDASNSSKDRIGRLMMLGVVIVATTHKLCALGKEFTADLLIMDEAGQCAPEVAVGTLAFTRRAIFVGDTQQLQPVTTISIERSEALAKQQGIAPEHLPFQLCPARGSGMAMAQRAATVTDGQTMPGVTLLYHYRCHPAIIGYCNALMYGGSIAAVRPDAPTAAGLPPMAWVAVNSSAPEQEGSSWKNEAELAEVVRWITHAHTHLTTAYQRPLNEVLAVITPLAAQARLARTYLESKLTDLLGAEVLEKMTIGTVHKLQGAERPVIAFSLVQNFKANASLFADRDGGFLMNVAVSRAKDSFIVFADRPTLNPAPADRARATQGSQGPIANLGRYMQKHGERLYPRQLVVVEAPGKVAAIERALGIDVAVIATSGNLGDSTLQSDGSLTWTDPPLAFTAMLAAHAGLVDELVIATDDDIAGELIGMQVAECAARHLHMTTERTTLPAPVKVRRMRFHDLTTPEIQLSLQCAGTNFDADYLAAALVREYLRHLDQQAFMRLLPGQAYTSAARRDIMAFVEECHDEAGWQVRAETVNQEGEPVLAFVPADLSSLAPPMTFATQTEALALAESLRGHPATYVHSQTVHQLPALYPPGTTQRILAAAADELGMLPWDAQDHLNALYQEGAH